MSRQRDDETTGWRPSLKMIGAAVLMAVVVVFALLNQHRTGINLFGAKFNSPLWLWLLIVLVLGVAVGSIFPWGRRKR